MARLIWASVAVRQATMRFCAGTPAVKRPTGSVLVAVVVTIAFKTGGFDGLYCANTIFELLLVSSQATNREALAVWSVGLVQRSGCSGYRSSGSGCETYSCPSSPHTSSR